LKYLEIKILLVLSIFVQSLYAVESPIEKQIENLNVKIEGHSQMILKADEERRFYYRSIWPKRIPEFLAGTILGGGSIYLMGLLPPSSLGEYLVGAAGFTGMAIAMKSVLSPGKKTHRTNLALNYFQVSAKRIQLSTWELAKTLELEKSNPAGFERLGQEVAALESELQDRYSKADAEAGEKFKTPHAEYLQARLAMTFHTVQADLYKFQLKLWKAMHEKTPGSACEEVVTQFRASQ
jgi:HPt (histidine-containing phosphotransfer) domain-containing protein